MTGGGNPGDPRELARRLKKLSAEKAALELVVEILRRVTPSGGGLINTVQRILSALMDIIGGANVVLWFSEDGRWFHHDIRGERGDCPFPDDPLVATAVEGKEFVEVEGPSFLVDVGAGDTLARGTTWVFPLTVGESVIGALKLEGVTIPPETSVRRRLEFACGYIALTLQAELLNLSRLKRAYDVARRSEIRYRTLFEDSPVSLWEEDFSDVKGIIDNLREQGVEDLDAYFAEHPDVLAKCARAVKILRVNRASVELYEAEDEIEFVKNPERIFLPESFEAFRGELIALSEGRTSYEVETVTQTMTGKKKHIHLRWALAPEYEQDWSRIIVSVVDHTERKQADEERERLEVQVRHTQKLESLGVLAGGIAHDFNNMLVSILGNADLALLKLPPAAPGREHIGAIEQAARRAADLCRQMLAYSGKGKFVIESLDISQVVREMGHMLEVSVSKKAPIRYQLADSLPAVDADPTQLRQIILNLIVNASEAIGDENGIISITTGVMDCDAAYLKNTYVGEDLPRGRYVFVEVSDTGCGMDDETREKLFDPFFSTKFAGRGLGMSAVLGIVRGHGGTIKIYSELGRGSTFKVLLPASARPADHAPEPEEAGSERWRVRGSVLLVDDDESVRQVGEAMLKHAGFTVFTASDGDEALQVFREHADEIRCVLLDLTMPRMDGEECFRELRRVRGDVCVVLSSGYNAQDVSQRFVGKGLAGFIQKPYRYENMAAVLREVLGE